MSLHQLPFFSHAFFASWRNERKATHSIPINSDLWHLPNSWSLLFQFIFDFLTFFFTIRFFKSETCDFVFAILVHLTITCQTSILIRFLVPNLLLPLSFSVHLKSKSRHFSSFFSLLYGWFSVYLAAPAFHHLQTSTTFSFFLSSICSSIHSHSFLFSSSSSTFFCMLAWAFTRQPFLFIFRLSFFCLLVFFQSTKHNAFNLLFFMLPDSLW